MRINYWPAGSRLSATRGVYIYRPAVLNYTATTVIDTKCAIIQSRLLRPDVKVAVGAVCLDSRRGPRRRFFQNNKESPSFVRNDPRCTYCSLVRLGVNDRYIKHTHTHTHTNTYVAYKYLRTAAVKVCYTCGKGVYIYRYLDC